MTTDLDETAAAFARVRPRLFGIAYRMLSSVQEAEDLVQEVWLKWQAYDRSTVREPNAFLTTTTTRLAINATQTARARRETYVGPWLPEPVDTAADPTLGAERAEALELAMLVLLEKLSPAQRAAYILREAFDYPYDQIAEIVQLSEANVRQLVSRSRKRLADERREPVSTGEQRKLLEAFLTASQEGDLAALVELLAADVVELLRRRRDRPGHPQAAARRRAGRRRHRRLRDEHLSGPARRPPLWRPTAAGRRSSLAMARSSR